MYLLLYVLVLVSLDVSNQRVKTNALSINLIHQDSTLSPFYNKSISSAELLRNAVQYSLMRVNSFNSSNSPQKRTVLPTYYSSGYYFMEIYIGTPRIMVPVRMDTVSSLFWVLCKPCTGSYDQEKAVYDPQQSSTYTTHPIGTKFCNSLPIPPEESLDKVCGYLYKYERDGSNTLGTLSSETFHSGGPEEDGNPYALLFGCSKRNHGDFRSPAQGVVGLARGILSLVEQLGNGIFSYCLPRRDETEGKGKLKFGNAAKISGEVGVVSTPLILEEDSQYYFVGLHGISMTGTHIDISENPIRIGIDSVSTVTILHSRLFDDVEKAVKKAIGVGVTPVEDPTYVYSLCYPLDLFKTVDTVLPDMVLHFKNADIRLKPLNIFQEYRKMYCLQILRNDGLSILGNLAQVNFKVEIDVPAKQVSFAPADCIEP